MRLDKLIVQGFKSFKDRTVISFDERITGIVGPNGCGKSNIIDALFWVMGEQSAKHLRGDKMSDLIFSGTNKYSPATFAEVTLVLENTQQKHIHIGQQIVNPASIELTRRLYRDGETEYRINNIAARLKDIQEVFMDTGAGAKSYAIIAQGEIDRLVRAKPQERRYMIDEVAGVTKFKVRRKESLKKLELTQSNLDRLKDLEEEVHKQLKHLEEQAKKAKKAKELRQKVQHHEWIVLSHRELNHLEDLMRAVAKMEELLIESEALKAKIQGLGLGSSEQELKQNELLSQLNEYQRQWQESKVALATLGEKIKYTKESLHRQVQRRQELTTEQQQLNQEQIKQTERAKQAQDQLEQLQQQRVETDQLVQLEQQLKEAQEQLKQHQQREMELRQQQQQSDRAVNQHQRDLFELSSKLATLGSQLQDMNQEVESLEQLQGPSQEEMQQKRDRLVELQLFVDSERQQLQQASQQWQSGQQQLKQQEREVQQLQQQVITLASRRDSLAQVQYKAILKKGPSQYAALGAQQADEIKLLSKVLHCEQPELLKVIQFGLKKELDSWLMSKEQLPAKAQFFADKKWGVDFLGIDALVQTVNNSLVPPSEIELKPLREVVSCQDLAYLPWFEQVMAGKWLCRGPVNQVLAWLQELSLDQRALVNRLIAFDQSYLIECQGPELRVDIAQSNQQEQRGQLEMARELEELAQQWQLAESRWKEQQTQLEIARETVQQQQQQLEERKNILSFKSESLASLRAEVQGQEKALQVGKSRLEQLFQRKAQLSQERLALMEREDEVKAQEEQLTTQALALKNQGSALGQALQQAKKTYDELYSKIVEQRAFIKNYEQQLQLFKQQLQDTQQGLERVAQKSVQVQQALQDGQQEHSQLEENLGELKQQEANLLVQLKEQEQQVSEVQNELHELNFELGEYLEEKKKLEQKLQKVEKESMEWELKAQRYRQDEVDLEKSTRDEKGFSLRLKVLDFLELSGQDVERLKLQELEPLVEGQHTQAAQEMERLIPSQVKESAEKLRRYKSELNALGEINWGADQDFERHKVRYEFLKEQGEELRKSKEDLLNAIALIDQKSAERFKVAFEEVKNKFSKVFPIIFGGGVASLELVGAVDDPECGLEIIARPPGKKMTNINLMSGGEKALTAVSLIFSIFLVKPSPFCLLDEVDAPLDDANVGRFNELLREMSQDSQFVLITHNKKTMELNNSLYGITMQEPGVSKALSVQLQ